MAQKIRTLFLDDLDGSRAEGTVHFGLDRIEYEIDLSIAHAKALRKALEKYIEASRRVSGPARRGHGNGRPAASSGPDPSEVREWARSQGIKVRTRGRIPFSLIARFRESTQT
jgi:hypothetical protein